MRIYILQILLCEHKILDDPILFEYKIVICLQIEEKKEKTNLEWS